MTIPVLLVLALAMLVVRLNLGALLAPTAVSAAIALAVTRRAQTPAATETNHTRVGNE